MTDSDPTALARDKLNLHDDYGSDSPDCLCNECALARAYLAQQAALAAANARADAMGRARITDCGEIEERASAAEAQVAALREGLEKYGSHKPYCRLMRLSRDSKCTCGLDAAKAGR